MAGCDDHGPQLYQIDPSGSYFAWKASAIGKNMTNAKTFLEKRYSEVRPPTADFLDGLSSARPPLSALHTSRLLHEQCQSSCECLKDFRVHV